MDAIKETLDFYNKNTSLFINDTKNCDMSLPQNKFLSYLKPSASILDLGCGSGRDTKAFLDKGFVVAAIDGCEAFCREASIFTGIKVRNLLFTDLNDENLYDGIWACSSILHASKSDLNIIFKKIYTALKDKGVLYTSFKYGTFEGSRNGRYFTDMTENSFKEFLSPLKLFDIKEEWITGDVRKGRESEKWLNIILMKK